MLTNLDAKERRLIRYSMLVNIGELVKFAKNLRDVHPAQKEAIAWREKRIEALKILLAKFPEEEPPDPPLPEDV